MTRYVCDLTHQLGFALSRPNPIRQVCDNMDMSDSDEGSDGYDGGEESAHTFPDEFGGY
jgi:hypothetical protein